MSFCDAIHIRIDQFDPSDVIPRETLYVSADGDDINGDGTIKSPFKSVGRCYQSMTGPAIITVLSMPIQRTVDTVQFWNNSDTYEHPIVHKITISDELLARAADRKAKLLGSVYATTPRVDTY